MGSCRGALILALVLAISGQTGASCRVLQGPAEACRGLQNVTLQLNCRLAGLEAQKNIPEPKLSKLMGPTIKFLYCYS